MRGERAPVLGAWGLLPRLPQLQLILPNQRQRETSLVAQGRGGAASRERCSVLWVCYQKKKSRSAFQVSLLLNVQPFKAYPQ